MIIKDIKYKSSKTVMVDLDSKYSPDSVDLSATLTLTMDDHNQEFFVKANNKEDAIEEVLSTLCYNILCFENDYTFNELGLPNPEYCTIEGDTGEIKSVTEFAGMENAEIHIPLQDQFTDLLHIKALELFKDEFIFE